MKKSDFVFAFLLVFVLVSGFVIAETISSETTGDSNTKVSDISGVNQKVNNYLENDIPLSPEMQLVGMVFFGIKSGVVEFQNLIILIILWVFLFIFVHNVVRLVPVFQSGISWAIAIIVTMLIGISGSLVWFVDWIVGFGKTVVFLKDYGLLSFIIILILLFVLYSILMGILDGLFKEVEKQEATQRGIRKGMALLFSKIFMKEQGINS